MTSRRALFISSTDMRANNGMAQGQQQLLAALCDCYPGKVDLLPANASPARARSWLDQRGFRVNVLQGVYPFLVRLNTMLWYGGGVILCNRLRWISRFYFPVFAPLPRAWIDRYDAIVCYYAWHHRMLRLERAGAKVVVDTGDVMADRHERTGARRWISMSLEDEKAVLTSGSRCLAVSTDDADEFERLYGSRPGRLSFVPPEHAKLVEIASADMPPRVGFMGAPSYVNEEILRLLSIPAFLGCLREANIEFLVAGGICNTVDRSVLDTLRNAGARVLGRVPSAVDYYSQISATVNPVGPSTGVKIKSVETLIAGRILITTRWGADAELAAAFPDQVVYIDWPIDPGALGGLCVQAVQLAKPSSRSAGEVYVRNAERALREVLSK